MDTTDAALALPFSTEALLEGLRPWVLCESPTFDAAAVNRMLDLAVADLAPLGGEVTRFPGTLGLADTRRIALPHPDRGQVPGLLVMAHLDTVHPVGTLAALPFRSDGTRAWGPGICDMKGGNWLAVAALLALAEAGIPTRLPVTILLTGDEEIGSPSTRAIIEAEAAAHAAVLVPEPARPLGVSAMGGVVSGRYAIARFNLLTTGRPSHAGNTPGDGRSAIREMCRLVPLIDAMTTEAASFSVGVIQGGTWVNCVATTCTAEALSMARRQPDLDAAVTAMLELTSGTEGVALTVTRGVTRPVWEAGAGTRWLHGRAEDLAKRLGHALPHASAGGGSDGNFTGAMGVPTLDGLGVLGAGYHTLDEHIRLDSLVPRARLLAGLLAGL